MSPRLRRFALTAHVTSSVGWVGAVVVFLALAVERNPSSILHSVLARLLLLVATVLALYKPQGMTEYGRRKQRSVAQP